jgi:hypothetical protein
MSRFDGLRKGCPYASVSLVISIIFWVLFFMLTVYSDIQQQQNTHQTTCTTINVTKFIYPCCDLSGCSDNCTDYYILESMLINERLYNFPLFLHCGVSGCGDQVVPTMDLDQVCYYNIRNPFQIHWEYPKIQSGSIIIMILFSFLVGISLVNCVYYCVRYHQLHQEIQAVPQPAESAI